jgi:hypothetical protein
MAAKPGARAKLTSAAYPQILAMLANGAKHSDIAKVFGVHQSTITRAMPKIEAASRINPIDDSTPESFVNSFENALAALQGITRASGAHDDSWRFRCLDAYWEKWPKR